MTAEILLYLLAGTNLTPFYADKGDLLYYLNARGERTEIKDKAGWNKRRAHIIANMEAVMGPAPKLKRSRVDVVMIEEVRLEQYTRRKITYLSEGNDRVPAYLLIPHGARERRAPAALCLHQTVRIGKSEPAGLGANPNLRYAAELAERGWVTIAPDYPNFGDYKVDAYAMGYASATMKGIVNHRRAVDVIETLPEVDRRRIAAIGHSLGGHNALFAAVFEPRIAAVVTSCGFNSFRKYYGGNLTGWSHRGYMPRIADVYGKSPEQMPFDFTEVLAAIAPRAVFINAPLGDRNFEVSGVRDCVTAAEPVYRLLGSAERLRAVYPDAGHEFPESVRREAYEWLEQTLRR